MLRAYDKGDGRTVYRFPKDHEPPKRAAFPCPQIIRPFAEPVQSMADGKYYTDPGSLRRTYKAANNPHGQDFIELGNEEPKFVEHKTDRKQMRDDIRQAMHDVKNGNVPPAIAAIE